MDPRRQIMHAAVAAGGASAALMHYAATESGERELRIAADQSLEPILRAAIHAIDATGGRPFVDERDRLKRAIEDFLDAAKPLPARCRICGCTEHNACIDVRAPEGVIRNCAWADEARTLCDNPACLEAAAAPAMEPST